jgi:hypothetical protein
MHAMLRAVTDGRPVNTPVYYGALNISTDDPAIFTIDDRKILYYCYYFILLIRVCLL